MDLKQLHLQLYLKYILTYFTWPYAQSVQTTNNYTSLIDINCVVSIIMVEITSQLELAAGNEAIQIIMHLYRLLLQYKHDNDNYEIGVLK